MKCSVLFLGSSVTYGVGGISFAEMMAEELGFECIKEAVSGTTLADRDASSYVSRLKKLGKELRPELCICQLSTNDATKKLPLGEISQGTELSDFDTSTITGAMEYIICYAKQTWGCGVAFYTGSRYDSESYAAMVQRVKELEEKWGIRVLDLWSDEAFNAISEEERALYMNDNIHPTKAGYRQWWCPELERQVISWLEETP